MVDTEGLTDFELPVTIPTPWLMLNKVASETVQDSRDESPRVMLVGLAANEEIVGGMGTPVLVMT